MAILLQRENSFPISRELVNFSAYYYVISVREVIIDGIKCEYTQKEIL